MRGTILPLLNIQAMVKLAPSPRATKKLSDQDLLPTDSLQGDLAPSRAEPTSVDEFVSEMAAGNAMQGGDPDEDFTDALLGNDQEFFIPVHDFVRFTDEEIQIIDHPAFQRLGRIYQLGQSFLVYRGATHKRLEHVLGTVHVAQKMVNAIRSNYHQFQKKVDPESTRCAFDTPLSDSEVRFVRLAALLHDIGHLPAGHTLEDELCLLEPHDADKRLNLVFAKKDWVQGVESMPLGDLIDQTYGRFIPAGLSASAREIIRRIVSKDAVGPDLPALAGIRIGVCRDIVGNTICADLLDYLYRDWHHVGKPKFFEKRLFQYMQIRLDARDSLPQFVVTYGQRNRPKRDAISAVLELLESRYSLAEAVLFHPTKCAAAAMLERGLSELYRSYDANAGEQEAWLAKLEDRLLRLSDEELITDFLKECFTHRCEPGQRIFQALALRDTYKSVVAVTHEDLEDLTRHLLVDRYIGRPAEDKVQKRQNKRRAAAQRTEALRLFESDFDLPAGSIVLYCPPLGMNSKIAEVKIIVRDSIRTLEEWDHDRQLAGGHCKAQLDRFKTLWRAEVFLKESEKIKLGKEGYQTFVRAVKLLLLGMTEDGFAPEKQAVDLASVLSAQPQGWFAGQTVMEALAARGGTTTKYPMGAPSLKSLFVPPAQRVQADE